jgi:hypothetical protein
MKKRTKIFLYVLIGVFILAISIQGEKGASAAVQLFVLFCIGWLLWRFLIFLRAFCRPIGKAVDDKYGSKIKKYGEKLNAHTDQSLRVAGLGKIADAGSSLNQKMNDAFSAIDNAMDKVEKRSHK